MAVALTQADGVSFVEHPQLARLQTALKSVDAGDRIVRGRLELFRYAQKRLSRRQQIDLEQRSPQSFSDSPLGPMSTDEPQCLLANLLGLMSQLFVDYDCTNLTPNDFQRCIDKHAVVNTINHNLAAIVDRIRGGFLTELWSAVQDAVDLSSCEVYALQPEGTFEPTDNALNSFNFFFVDAQHGRILYVGGLTQSRSRTHAVEGSESDVTLSDSLSNSSKGHGSSMGSSLHEGEYAFDSDGSRDDAMMD